MNLDWLYKLYAWALGYLVAVILAVWTWMRADEAEAVRVDARLAPTG